MIKNCDDGVCIDLKEHQMKTVPSKKPRRSRGYGFGGKENPFYEISEEIKSNSYFRKREVEASDFKSIKTYHPFDHGMIEAIHQAFSNHNALEIYPDAIWLMICQAVSTHEEKTGILGKLFNLPNPKKTIEIRADDFSKGSPNNDWSRVFGQFEDGIKQNIPESLYNIMSNKKYSTTTKLESICFTICLMDSLKKYFSYRVMTLCNIPQIYLKGTKEDWEELYSNTKILSESGLELESWFPIILTILEKFNEAFDPSVKEVDSEFWNSIYKYRGAHGSGESDKITGWIAAFFPYIDGRKALWLGRLNARDVLSGKIMIDTDVVPAGVNCVPFVWSYLGTEFKYNFYGGLLGVQQNKDTLALSARMGWAVGEDKPKPEGRGRW